MSDEGKEFLSRLLTYDHNKRISFQELFAHPYLMDYEKLKEEEYQVKEEDEMDEDFIILERDESIHEAQVFKKDYHPMVDITNLINSMKTEIELCSILEKIAGKIKKNANFLIALAILLDATSILERKAIECKDMIVKYDLNPISFPSFFENFENLKEVFNIFVNKSEEISRRFDGIRSVEKIEKSLEEFLHNYALDVCRQAAGDEYLQDYNESKAKYQEAKAILDYLNKNYCIETSANKKKLESFIRETNDRLQHLAIKLSLQ